jgi:hypothetical protein
MQLPVRVSDRGHENEIRRAADPLSADRQASIKVRLRILLAYTDDVIPPHLQSQVVPGNATGILLINPPSYPATTGHTRPIWIASRLRSNRQRLDPSDCGYGYRNLSTTATATLSSSVVYTTSG